ncbi:MAG TPA: XRE family transcriptional regulator [Tepidisphaeraceae bacterium]|jgi:predicted XRE-type DNA-binding protein|nr:XRE family transcriptional regulator [Tepidisphaeraceae bacterium]
MKKHKKQIVVHDTFELASVLGLNKEDAIAMEFRARLNRKIVELVKSKELSHVEVAKAARASRTRVTAILNGQTMGISTDCLLRILYALGCKTMPTFSQIRPAA